MPSAPVRGDFLHVVVQNNAANKLDWYLDRDISYTVTPADGSANAVLEVKLTNHAPASGQPLYVAGGPPIGQPPGTNRSQLSVYSTLAATEATLDGRPVLLSTERELGRYVHTTQVQLPPGASATLRLKLTGPLPKGTYTLDVVPQPGPKPATIRVDRRVPPAAPEVAVPAGPLDRTIVVGRREG